MMGAFRFLLALMVATAHLTPHIRTAWLAMYAVFGFYVLSGYLMALVLNKRYWPSGNRATLRFFANRALRIYPPYLAAAALALMLAIWNAEASRATHKLMVVPDAPNEWLSTLFLVGTLLSGSRLIPQSWSLEVELFFYLVMGTVAARHRWIAGAWLLGSLVYTGHLVASDAVLLKRYVSLGAASLPFSLGASVYFLRDSIPRPGARVASFAVAAFLAHAVLARWLWTSVGMAGFYTSLGLVVIVVALLSRLDVRKNSTFEAWGNRLGDLSYPLFLTHFQAACVVRAFAPELASQHPNLYCGAALILACALAYGVHRLIEMPIESLRASLRTGAAATSA